MQKIYSGEGIITFFGSTWRNWEDIPHQFNFGWSSKRRRHSSGNAATLLNGGRTVHSTFKLPLDLTREVSSKCQVEQRSSSDNAKSLFGMNVLWHTRTFHFHSSEHSVLFVWPLPMTIKKSQGQSLKIAEINLEIPCFSHGQLYVACSWVGPGNNLCIRPKRSDKEYCILYSQVFGNSD